MAKRGRKPKGQKDIEKDLPDGFAEAMASASDMEVKAKLCDAARLGVEYKKLMKNDLKVAQAKAELDNVVGPYKDDIKSANAQVEYCSLLLDQRGAVCT